MCIEQNENLKTYGGRETNSKVGAVYFSKACVRKKLYTKKGLKIETETIPRQFLSLFTGF
jgi:hypothetical protein